MKFIILIILFNIFTNSIAVAETYDVMTATVITDNGDILKGFAKKKEFGAIEVQISKDNIKCVGYKCLPEN